MNVEPEPARMMTIYHLTDARARCIAHRVVRQVLEEVLSAGGDTDAILDRLSAGQRAADQSWEDALEEWERQCNEDADAFSAWKAAAERLSLGERQDALERWRRERAGSRRFQWPPLGAT
jgi:uncharacterized NAD(P)/FAD-binding protein YdhS